MPQIFRPRADHFFRLLFALGVVIGVGVLFLLGAINHSEYSTGVNQVITQPIPFSHRHHAGELGIDCRYCHTTVEKSSFAGMPSTHTCMSCHSQIWTNAEMLAPLRESFNSGVSISWSRVNHLPDFVYFDHSIHISRGVSCTSCHGAVEKMPLTHKANSFHMQWCLNCHRHPEAYTETEPSQLTNCTVCHR